MDTPAIMGMVEPLCFAVLLGILVRYRRICPLPMVLFLGVIVALLNSICMFALPFANAKDVNAFLSEIFPEANDTRLSSGYITVGGDVVEVGPLYSPFIYLPHLVRSVSILLIGIGLWRHTAKRHRDAQVEVYS